MKDDTLCTILGRDPHHNHGVVNPPVYHASTILFPTLDALEQAGRTPNDGTRYGRKGTPTTFALEDAIAQLEGGHRSIALPSGLAAVCASMLAFVKTGDHVLVADNVYGPTRTLCDRTLKRLGVETTYFDPDSGGRIAALMRPNTVLVYIEAPGSLTFEMTDVPAVAAAAHQHGAVVVMDNTWATPLFFKPFEHGVDVSVHAGTKYIVGHSDAMMGIVTGTEKTWPALRAAVDELGYHAAPDDVYLALRGLRTLSVRLKRHHETGLTLARWLADRPEVVRVMHPGLPQDPGHQIWRRDFAGASGLFGFVLQPTARPALAALLDHINLFGMGYSWGGFESLLLPVHPEKMRGATHWQAPGPTLRVHAGLEDPDDLIAELEAGFKRMTAAA